MGIKQLTKLLNEHCPAAIKEGTLADLNGRKIAIDGSMAIYQFLVAVRSSDGAGGASAQLTNEAGEVTSHLQGFWYRTLKFLDAGIKPVYVFDGKPPTLKGGQLAKRKDAKEAASKALEAAQEAGNIEDVERFSKRTVKMDKTHIDDCKRLLRLMGMPVVEAPCEAEAQCAELAKAGAVYAAASEDMDTLTFGAPILVRRMWASESQKLPTLEFNLEKVLAGLELTYDQFVDVCILAGCDYCETIKGVAATTAYKEVKKHGSLEAFVAKTDKEKLPEGVDYSEVRKLFVTPEVMPAAEVELKWVDPDEAGIIEYLVKEKGFSAERIATGIAKLKKARTGGQQMRMDAFFKSVPSDAPPPSSGVKRKAEEEKLAKAKAAKDKKSAGKPGSGGAKGGAAKKAKK